MHFFPYLFEDLEYIYLMHRNIRISKETLDKARLAKKYIEDRYQGILDAEADLKEKCMRKKQKKQSLAFINNKDHTLSKRLQRQKDSLKNYNLYSLIGRGAFGEVRLAQEISSGLYFAIKRLKKQKITEKKQIYNAYLQRELMGNSHSQYIVQMHSAFQDESHLYIVMEYVPGGDLLHLLIEKDILSEEQTKFYIAEMVLAVQEVHKMGFVHRDIKPDNILLDKNGHVKISDFGLSKYLSPTPKKRRTKLSKLTQIENIENRNKIFSKVGTPDYISPEVLTQDTYDQSVDIWGIGVIMFQCLYGYPPFTDEDSAQVCCHVMQWLEHLEFPKDISSSTEAKMLILGLINDRSRRLSIPEIKKHPFFEGLDWKNLHKLKSPYIPPLKNELDVGNFDKYQLQEPWKSDDTFSSFKKLQKFFDIPIDEPDQNKQNVPQKKSSRLFYSFAGFDFQRKSQNKDHSPNKKFAERKSCSNKSQKKMLILKGQKRLKTEENHKKIVKNLTEKTLFSLFSNKMKQTSGIDKQGKRQFLKESQMEKKLKKIGRNEKKYQVIKTDYDSLSHEKVSFQRVSHRNSHKSWKKGKKKQWGQENKRARGVF